MRRGAGVVAAAFVLAACGGEPVTTPGGHRTPTAVSSSGTAEAEATCAPTEYPTMQEGGHLIGDNEPPVPYSSVPGTSGWHASGAPRTGVFGTDDALSEPDLVLALEIGQVVAAYDPAELPADDVTALTGLATTAFPDTLTVTPFTTGDMGAPLVLNAWGARQPCRGFDEVAVRAFLAEQLGTAPAH